MTVIGSTGMGPRRKGAAATARPIPMLPPGGTPFIAISPKARIGIIAFVLLYHAFAPAMLAITHGIEDPYVGIRMLLETTYWMLMLAPLFLYRREFGWLHPLIFPLLFSMLRWLSKSPDTLLAPLSVLVPGEKMELPVLLALPQASAADTSIALIKAHLAKILALLAYYAGYFMLPPIPAKAVRFSEPKRLGLKVGVALGIAAVVLITFMALRGGLVEHLTSLSRGRFRSLNVWAPVTVLVTLAPYAVAIWAAYRPNVVRNPIFWIIAILAAGSMFLSTGSRGSIINFLAIIGIGLIARWRKVPFVQAALAIPLVFLMVGLLGMIRSSAWQEGQTTLRPIQEGGLAGVIEYTNQHINLREELSGEAPVMARVPDEIAHLNGKSYGNVVGFLVPRRVWPDKPRGVGHYYAVDFLGRPEDGGGAPIGEVAEAYWNFGIPGIIFVFLLFGAFHRQVARMVVANQHVPLTWPILATTLVLFTPGSSVVEWIQGMIMIFVLAFAFGILRRPKKARAPVFRPGPRFPVSPRRI